MNIKSVLKVYAGLRQLTDDETALLETLRAFTDAEREQFVEALQPAKATQAAAKPGERCTHVYESGVVCGGAKRNVVHHNTNHVDYHEFTVKKAVKSSRASSLAEKIKGTAGSNGNPVLCTYEMGGGVCHGRENDSIHDQTMGYVGYHEFAPPESAAAASGD